MSKRKINDNLWGMFFIMPTLLGLIVLNFYPMFNTVFQSFHRTGDFGMSNTFIGFANYERLLLDSEFWQTLWNTVRYTLYVVPLAIIISLILAVFLNGKIFGKTTFRVIYFLPMVAAPAAVGMVWRWMYNTQFGLVNYLLGTDISWVSDRRYALISLAIIGIWGAIGNNMILFLAGLQGIPSDFYEAAEIDGATGIRKFFHITVPLVSPMIFFVSVTSVIGALATFDSVFMVMGEANPAMPWAQTLVYLFYRNAFVMTDWGMGSTIVMMIIFVTLIVTVFQMIAQKKWVHYN